MGLHETNLLSKQASLGITRGVLASLTGMSETVLCRGLSGSRPLTSVDIISLNKTLNDLSEIQRIIYPLKLPLSDVASLKILLAKFRDDGLDRIVDATIVDDLRREIAAIQAL